MKEPPHPSPLPDVERTEVRRDRGLDIVIRPARPGDVPRMAELLTELFSIESDFTPDKGKQERGLRALVTGPSWHSLVLVATAADGTVVGMATVQTLISTAEGGRAGLIEDVIVDKEHRRRGIGALLLGGIVDWSRKAGLKRLQLLADRDNQPALDFYSKNGWNGTKLNCWRISL